MNGKYEEKAASDINTVDALKSKLCSRAYRNRRLYPEKCAECMGCKFGGRLILLLENEGSVFVKAAPERSLTHELMQEATNTSLIYRIRRHLLGREE